VKPGSGWPANKTLLPKLLSSRSSSTLARQVGSPFAEVTNSESFIAAVAEREDEARVRVSVYRTDQSDPQPIIVDEYVILERFPASLDVWGLIQSATTDPGPNFIRYRDDHVFLVKEQPGDQHWLDTLPGTVTALLDDARSAV
jgi:hypothetical protein